MHRYITKKNVVNTKYSSMLGLVAECRHVVSKTPTQKSKRGTH